MIIGTIFSITPAFVYWLAGFLAANGDPVRPDGRRHRRVHDAPEPALLPAGPAAQRPGRDPGLAGAVRPDLRIPRDGPRDRRRPRRRRARPDAGPRAGPVPQRLVPLPDRGRALERAIAPARRLDAESGPADSDRPAAGPKAVPGLAGRRGFRADRARGRPPAAAAVRLEDIDFEAEPGRAGGARRPVGLRARRRRPT